jgi:glycosyltransferase involved in cell wall biosynthesis
MMSARRATLPERSPPAGIRPAFASRAEPVARPTPSATPDPRLLDVVRWPVGGIRTHLQHNYPVAAGGGYRFTFVGPADGSLGALRDHLPGLDDAEFVGVPVQGRRCPIWRVVRPLLRSGRFALVHSHGLTAAAHATLAGLGTGVPHVVTLHEPLRPSQFPGLRGRVKRWLLGRALRRADRVITVSEDARANLLEYFPRLRRREERLLTLANGIDARRYASGVEGDSCELGERLGLGPGALLVGFLGRFMPEKGFPLLLDAVERLVREGRTPAFHLVAFGSGDYRREYEKAVGRRGLGGRVTLLDFVADVRPVLRQLDLVVVPSLWEASSLVSMEAMASGVPVLGSDCVGLREVLRGTPSRVVRAGDADALRCGLQVSLADLWTEAARAYAPAARERFDNAPTARRLTELYGELLQRRWTHG